MVIIGEFPDNVAAAVCAMLVVGAGTASSYKTTVLLTPDQAVEAMKKAGTLAGSYKPPAPETVLPWMVPVGGTDPSGLTYEVVQ